MCQSQSLSHEPKEKTHLQVDFEYAAALNRMGVPVQVHIKIDTGMHRLGISGSDFLNVKKVFSMHNLTICGMFTHLC